MTTVSTARAGREYGCAESISIMRHRTIFAVFAAAVLASMPPSAAALHFEQDGAAPATLESGATAPTPAERPRPLDSRALFSLFASSPGLEAEYEEDKHLALLAAPLRSRGVLRFLPLERLAREVTYPEPSSVLITPNELTTTSQQGTVRLELGASPELRAFVTSLANVFSGRRDALAGAWSIDYVAAAGDERGWSLALAPREGAAEYRALSNMVRTLTLFGEGEAVVRIELVEPNGDRTVTRILRADAERLFDASERNLYFGIAAGSDVPRRELAPAHTVEELFQRFAASPGVEAAYEETSSAALPTRRLGWLRFYPPHKLALQVDSPRRTRSVIGPGVATFEDLGATPPLVRDEEPVRALVGEVIAAVLGGELDALRADWRVEHALAADALVWRLRLVPRADTERGARSAKLLDSLTWTGRGDAVERIECLATSGEVIALRLLWSDFGRRFTDVELAAFFGAGPRGASAGEDRSAQASGESPR